MWRSIHSHLVRLLIPALVFAERAEILFDFSSELRLKGAISGRGCYGALSPAGLRVNTCKTAPWVSCVMTFVTWSKKHARRSNLDVLLFAESDVRWLCGLDKPRDR